MSKRLLVLFVLVTALVLASCSQVEETVPSENQTVSGDGLLANGVELAADSSITLTGLENGVLYGLWATGVGRSESSRAAGGNLIPTDGGTWLLPSDGSDFTFTGREVGIRNRGVVRMVRYQDRGRDRVIDTTTDIPVDIRPYRDDPNARFFEEYYSVDLKEEGLDLSRIALMNYSVVTKSGGFSSDYGIIDAASGRLIHGTGIMDLSGYDEVGIFNQVVARNEGQRRQEVVLLNPKKLETDTSTKLEKTRYLYEVDEASCTGEMVLEVDIGNNNIRDYYFESSCTDGRIAYGQDSGKRKPYIFPISYDETTGIVLLYVGEVDESFIFEVITSEDVENPGTIKLRDITDDERDFINFIDVKDGGEAKVEVNSDDYFTPVIFTSDSNTTLEQMQVMTDYTGPYTVRLVCGHIGGGGYSELRLPNHEARDEDFSNDVLEYSFVVNREGKSGSVTYHFSKTGFTPDEGGVVTVDAAGFANTLQEQGTQLDWNDDLRLENLEVGTVYGLFVVGGCQRDDERLIRVHDDFFCFIATDTTMVFPSTSFNIYDKADFHFIHFDFDEDNAFDTKSDSPVLTTEEGELFVFAHEFDLEPGDGIHALVEQSEGESSKSSGRYFFNPLTGEEILENGAVYDFFGLDSVIMVSRTLLYYGDFKTQYSLVQAQPITGEEGPFTLPGLFTLPAMDGELVIEMTYDENCDFSTTDALRYPMVTFEDGTRTPYFYPFTKDEDTRTVLIYAGEHEKPVYYSIIDYYGSASGSVKLRKISEEEKAKIQTIELSSDNRSFDFHIDDGLTLILVQAEDPKGWTVSSQEPVLADVAVKSYWDGNAGSSSSSVTKENGWKVELQDEAVLEAILVKSWQAEDLTLTFTRN